MKTINLYVLSALGICIAVGGLLSGGFVKAASSDRLQDEPMMCTMQYDPVCAQKQVQCIKAPCPPIQQTYGNACMAHAAGAEIIIKGECSDLSGENNPIGGDRDEHGCIGSAGYQRNEDVEGCVRPWETDENLVTRAHKIGLTKYDRLEDFMPSRAVTREQAAKMLMVLIDHSGVEEWMVKQSAGSCEWKDASSLDPSLESFVGRSCKKGLFQGSEGYFFPHRAITREHMGFLLKRLANYVPQLQDYQDLIVSGSVQSYTRLDFVKLVEKIYHKIKDHRDHDVSKASQDLATAQKLWESKNITSYTMVQSRSCFCPEEWRRPMMYKVENNSILTGSVRYDDGEKEQLPSRVDATLNSVPDAFKIIQDAIKDKVAKLEVTYDETLGYPKTITIDYSEQIADEEQYLSFDVRV